jgi:RNA polymerase sigma factor (sigma-70 family)
MLVTRYDRLIHAVIRGFRLPEADGADVYQRVVLTLYQELRGIRQPSRLASWIVTTTKRECLSERRRRDRQDAASLDDHDPPDDHDLEDEIGRVLDMARVAEAIDDLEPRCRDILRLLFLDRNQPAYAEIAERLGIAVGNIGPTRARCLELLRRRLRGHALLRRFGRGKGT